MTRAGMKVLFTGGSSALGAPVLAHLLEAANVEEVACTIHRRAIASASPKLRQHALDLARDDDIDEGLSRIDLLVHLAAVTHADAPDAYRRVNVDGSLRLIDRARARGCRHMMYVSTRCVGPKGPRRSCGAYAESKRAFEDAVLAMEWDSLVILRPAEVYGAGGSEGIDRFIHLARTLRIIPMMFGERRIRFAPLHCSDFTRAATELLDSMPDGTHIYEVCGPEVLDGVAIAKRLSRTFKAVPIPMWFPMIEAALRGLRAMGLPVIAPDQIDRLLGDKSSDVSSPALRSRFSFIRFGSALCDQGGRTWRGR